MDSSTSKENRFGHIIRVGTRDLPSACGERELGQRGLRHIEWVFQADPCEVSPWVYLCFTVLTHIFVLFDTLPVASLIRSGVTWWCGMRLTSFSLRWREFYAAYSCVTEDSDMIMANIVIASQRGRNSCTKNQYYKV